MGDGDGDGDGQPPTTGSGNSTSRQYDIIGTTHLTMSFLYFNTVIGQHEISFPISTYINLMHNSSLADLCSLEIYYNTSYVDNCCSDPIM